MDFSNETWQWLMPYTTILSIGDGLVSQIPSIIVSIAAGILVTRSSEEANLGEYVGKQLVVYPKAMAISGVLLLLFSIFLSDTFWPFFTLAIACFACAYFLYKKSENEPEFSKFMNLKRVEHLLPPLQNPMVQFQKVMVRKIPFRLLKKL